MLKSEHVQMSAASVKQSHNSLLPTSKYPSFLNLHTAKHGDLIELSVDRFSLLTKQPKSLEHMNLYNYATVESDLRKRRDYAVPSFQKLIYPRATPVNFKWSSDYMPKIKVKKSDASTKNAYDDALNWKQMLYMNEKNAAERIQEIKHQRQERSKEFEAGSIRKLKKIRENSKKMVQSAGSDKGKKRHDIWSSDNFKDVNLSKEISEMMYSTENRRIRHGRRENPNFFKQNTNDIFDKMHKLTVKNEAAAAAAASAPAPAVTTQAEKPATTTTTTKK